jgi:hypothetical protein
MTSIRVDTPIDEKSDRKHGFGGTYRCRRSTTRPQPNRGQVRTRLAATSRTCDTVTDTSRLRIPYCGERSCTCSLLTQTDRASPACTADRTTQVSGYEYWRGTSSAARRWGARPPTPCCLPSHPRIGAVVGIDEIHAPARKEVALGLYDDQAAVASCAWHSAFRPPVSTVGLE